MKTDIAFFLFILLLGAIGLIALPMLNDEAVLPEVVRGGTDAETAWLTLRDNTRVGDVLDRNGEGAYLLMPLLGVAAFGLVVRWLLKH